MKYNNWYSQKYPGLGDAKGAVELENNCDACRIYKDNLKESFLETFSEIPLPQKTNTQRQIKRDCIYANNRKKIPYNENADCLCKFLKVIYTIRCNFFHGSKEPTDSNIALICWANDTLNQFMITLKTNNVVNFDEFD